MPDTDRDPARMDGFLARWSERKRAASEDRSLSDPEDEPTTPESVAEGAVASLGSEPDSGPTPAPETRLTDADMPPLASLDGRADYSGFLSPGVSPGLRRQALAQLFRSAHLNVTDGLDDFDEDFRAFKPMGGLVTADMRYHAEQAARRLASLSGETVDDAGAPEGSVRAGEAGIPPDAPPPDAAPPDAAPDDVPAALLAAEGPAAEPSAEAARLAARPMSDTRADQPRLGPDGDTA